jgi:hypothetical protein
MMRAAHCVCVSRLSEFSSVPMFWPVRLMLAPFLSGFCSNFSTYNSLFFHQNLFNMKRMSFQLSVKALLVAFFMISGFAAVTETSAQSGSLASSAVATTVALVDADQATIRLNNEVMVNHQLLGNYVPGTPSYTYVYRRAAYFKAIINEIANGATVNASIVNALPQAATLGGEKESLAFTSKTELTEVYNEAIALLKL